MGVSRFENSNSCASLVSTMKNIENQLLVFPSGLGRVVGRISRLALEQLGYIVNIGRVEKKQGDRLFEIWSALVLATHFYRRGDGISSTVFG